MCSYNIRKTILTFTLIFNVPSIMTVVFASFKHLEQQISITMPVTILQIVFVCMTVLSSNLSS